MVLAKKLLDIKPRQDDKSDITGAKTTGWQKCDTYFAERSGTREMIFLNATFIDFESGK